MSTDCIDAEARDRIAELAREHEKLAGVVWGPDGKNGLRSKVANLEAWKDETCPSLEEFEGHIAACEDAKEGEVEVKVAEISAQAAVVAAKSAAQAAVQAARASAKGQVNREWVVIAGMGLLVLRDVIVPLLKAVPK